MPDVKTKEFDLDAFIKEQKEKLRKEGKLEKMAKIRVGKEIYVVRGFNREEWIKFVNEKTAENIAPESTEFELEVIANCLVYPQLSKEDIKANLGAGVVLTLSDSIMSLSGFVTEPIETEIL